MLVIYESPDGGRTVYVREMGSSVKKLHYDATEDKADMKELLLRQEWMEIRHAAKTNPVLQKSVEHIIMLYRIMKDGDTQA